MQNLNKETSKTLIKVEKNAMGILKQLKDVKNDSQDVIKASTDAVSIIAAARSGLNKLKHGPQCNEETEWLNLS